ncbi:CRISPR-associated helicase Cas3' [Runella sp. MFBS21]|uniref:CRISPR-associated helicase Cas3' n=1 Tax=Runella sp. MFBS21 TaxID=3034018 RepID=UPI0023F87648|nr:CRISPR-associated helicase Cas3' [Runella sp. MFBS21]MDF7816786.1 CRISPR-associated helicase Cas3' [Runella sp. MFBS21]
MILAKPSGISLKAHTLRVQLQATIFLDKWPTLQKKYKELTKKDDLLESLSKVIEWHDRGKELEPWQIACRQDYIIYSKWLQKNRKQEYSKSYKEFERQKDVSTGTNLRDARFRHEFGSLYLAEKENANLSFFEKVAIAAHHGKLHKRFEDRWKNDDKGKLNFEKYWGIFLRTSFELFFKDSQRWEKLLLERYKMAAVRALLQLADTRASREEAEGKLAPLDTFIYNCPFRDSLKEVQKAALQIAKDWTPDNFCSILRAPTGSGKTDAALLWAEELIKQKHASRLIIAMPTRFTSNSLAVDVNKNVLSDTGLYHSSAWFNRFGNAKPEEKDYCRELQKSAQLFVTPVTVCTIDHLLISLTGTAEHHHSSFFFMANSAVVFDEADFYDPFIQANLTVLLKVLRILRVPVLIMSATVPDSSTELYQVAAISEPQEITKPPIRKLAWAGRKQQLEDESTIYITDFDSETDSLDCEDALQKMIDEGHGIVYANTVERALHYYNWLKEQPNCPELIMYHSRFTEPDKKAIENTLLSMLGKDSWRDYKEKNKPVRGIAILTQIGEMSINISSTVMLSDLCPWDRLTQRLGRLNRFNQSNNPICFVTVPFKKGKPYVAPYGTIEKKKWQPSEAFTNTLQSIAKFLNNDSAIEVTPEEMVRQVNLLYPELKEFSDKAETNRKNLEDLMQQNWLIVPDRKIDEDEGKVVGKWQSRDIEEQRTVFVKPPEDFNKYIDYQGFSLEYGISIPVWMIEKELRKGSESKVQVVEVNVDEKPVKLIYTDAYYDEPSNIETGEEKKTSSIGLASFYKKPKEQYEDD